MKGLPGLGDLPFQSRIRDAVEVVEHGVVVAQADPVIGRLQQAGHLRAEVDVMLGGPLTDVGIDVPAHGQQRAVVQQRLIRQGNEATADMQRQPALMFLDKRIRIERAKRYDAVVLETAIARHQLGVQTRDERPDRLTARAVEGAKDVHRLAMEVVRGAEFFHQAIQTHRRPKSAHRRSLIDAAKAPRAWRKSAKGIAGVVRERAKGAQNAGLERCEQLIHVR